MDFLAPYHPAIVHLPIAFLIGSVLFEIVGRAVDLDWWRQASFVLLLFGVLGAGVAVLSGSAAEEPAEKRQGVPEAAIEHHEQMALATLVLGSLAVVARLASNALPGRALVSAVALLLQIATGVTVGLAGYRGGELVFQRGAGVRLHGELVRSGAPEREDEPSPPPK